MDILYVKNRVCWNKTLDEYQNCTVFLSIEHAKISAWSAKIRAWDILTLKILDQATKQQFLKEFSLVLSNNINNCCVKRSRVYDWRLRSKPDPHKASQKSHRKLSWAVPIKYDEATKQQTQKASSTKGKHYNYGRDQEHKRKECSAFGQSCNTREKKKHTSVYIWSKNINTYQHTRWRSMNAQGSKFL